MVDRLCLYRMEIRRIKFLFDRIIIDIYSNLFLFHQVLESKWDFRIEENQGGNGGLGFWDFFGIFRILGFFGVF
jgi:hypothetical protein